MRRGVVALVAAGVAAAAFLAPASARRADSTALLARYAPALQLYAVDQKPSAIEPFLAGANLERLSGGTWRVVQRSPPASALVGGSKQLRLNTRGCSPAVSAISCYSRRMTPPTLYGRAWTGSGTAANTTVLQYWLFYPLDDWRNSLTKPTIWYLHEGDWEAVSVELGTAGKPVAVAASQHNLGVNRPWRKTPTRGGTHPVVYVALGSHANYLSPGFRGAAGVPHVVTPRFSGVPLSEPDFTSAQASVRSPAIVDVSDGLAPWLSFAGAWGDGSYLLLTRKGSKNPFSRLPIGDSPPGPAFHGIWRDPLEPFRDWPADDGH
jgi:hypothetical protein